MSADISVVLELYVQGQSSNSNAALALVQRICEAEFPNDYSLEVIDINHHSKRAVDSGILATPALVRIKPEPVLRTIGLFDNSRVRRGLGLHE